MSVQLPHLPKLSAKRKAELVVLLLLLLVVWYSVEQLIAGATWISDQAKTLFRKTVRTGIAVAALALTAVAYLTSLPMLVAGPVVAAVVLFALKVWDTVKVIKGGATPVRTSGSDYVATVDDLTPI